MIAKGKMLGLMLAAIMVASLPMVVYADNVEQKASPSAEASHQDGDWHHGQHEKMMAKILALSDDQVKQLKDLHQKQRESMKSNFEQIKTNREAFEAEIVKAAPDMNKITDLQNKLKAIQSQITDDRLNSVLAVKKVLTPEQYAGYVALKKEKRIKKHMMKEHGKFFHKGGFGNGGNEHKNWGDKSDKDHGPDDQD